MHYIFVNPVSFESWDYRNPDTVGIGGSETNAIEMAWRLAARGNRVIVYAPIAPDCYTEWRGTEWRHIDDFKGDIDGIHIIYRDPSAIDKLLHGQTAWLICQDVAYPNLTDERIAKFEKIVCLCKEHAHDMIKRCPSAKDKIVVGSNGIRMDLIRQIEKEEEIVRNPKRIMFASSPDRGLIPLLKIFKRARELVPDLELHYYYGFDNIDKIIADEKNHGQKAWRKIKEEILELSKQEGITFHGRTNQIQLYKEWRKAGLWVHPSIFSETSCITSMEAQALGAIPITIPVWAVRENVRHGAFIEGDPNDPLTQVRFAAEIMRFTNDGFQQLIRKDMMPYARTRFNYERQVDQWEAIANGFDNHQYYAQYCFQLKHAKGKILNIGCDIDHADLASRGATNVDVVDISPATGLLNKAHVKADARELPVSLHGRFDTVILGDILEHMNDEDSVIALQEAVKCLKVDGSIIVTHPSDERKHDYTHDYAPNCPASHQFTLTKEKMLERFIQANLTIKRCEELDYTFSLGYAYIVCP